MGRKRTVHKDLPPRLYRKRDGYYYRSANGEKRIARLLAEAMAKKPELKVVEKKEKAG